MCMYLFFYCLWDDSRNMHGCNSIVTMPDTAHMVISKQYLVLGSRLALCPDSRMKLCHNTYNNLISWSRWSNKVPLYNIATTPNFRWTHHITHWLMSFFPAHWSEWPNYNGTILCEWCSYEWSKQEYSVRWHYQCWNEINVLYATCLLLN